MQLLKQILQMISCSDFSFWDLVKKKEAGIDLPTSHFRVQLFTNWNIVVLLMNYHPLTFSTAAMRRLLTQKDLCHLPAFLKSGLMFEIQPNLIPYTYIVYYQQ